MFAQMQTQISETNDVVLFKKAYVRIPPIPLRLLKYIWSVNPPIPINQS